jgi:hypothetical protein
VINFLQKQKRVLQEIFLTKPFAIEFLQYIHQARLLASGISSFPSPSRLGDSGIKRDWIFPVTAAGPPRIFTVFRIPENYSLFSREITQYFFLRQEW